MKPGNKIEMGNKGNLEKEQKNKWERGIPVSWSRTENGI